MRIKTDGGGELFYAHLKASSKNKNDRIQAGDVIAYSGNTGWSTGPHLHYQISRNNALTDPLKSVEMKYTAEVVNEYKDRGEILN